MDGLGFDVGSWASEPHSYDFTSVITPDFGFLGVSGAVLCIEPDHSSMQKIGC